MLQCFIRPIQGGKSPWGALLPLQSQRYGKASASLGQRRTTSRPGMMLVLSGAPLCLTFPPVKVPYYPFQNMHEADGDGQGDYSHSSFPWGWSSTELKQSRYEADFH